MKRVRLPLLFSGLAAIALAIAGAAWLLIGERGRQALIPDDFGRGDYRLVMTDGRPFTEETLRGQPSLVFFGFTHCPDICPTTLGDIAMWQDELGDAASDLRVFVISVDPERDTPEMMAEYVGWLPGAYGVTGTVEESRKAQRAFRTFSQKVPLEGDAYTMDHSSSVLVFDAEGRFFTNISYQSPPETALAKIRQVLG